MLSLFLCLFVFIGLSLCQTTPTAVCSTLNNNGPRGQNQNCPTDTPYCVLPPIANAVAFCSSCNPGQGVSGSLCDCPVGQWCEQNYTNNYGTCQPWPLYQKTCGSQADCYQVYTMSNGQSYFSLQLPCLFGICGQCDYILDPEVTTCTAGTQIGQTRTCVKPGEYASSGASSSLAKSMTERVAQGAALALFVLVANKFI